MQRQLFCVLGVAAMVFCKTTPCLADDPHQVLDRFSHSLDWEKSVHMVIGVHSKLELPKSLGRKGGEQDQTIEFSRHDESLGFVVENTSRVAGRDPEIISSKTYAVIENGLMLSYAFEPPDIQPDRVMMLAITPPKRLNMLICDVSLMDGYLSGGGDKSLVKILEGADDLKEEDKPDTIDGHQCIVLDAIAPEGRLKVWVCPDQNYAMLKLTLERDENSLFDGKPLSEQKYSSKDGEQLIQASIVWDQVVNKKVGDFFVPFSGRLVDTSRTKNGEVSSLTETYNRKSIELNPDFSKLKPFTLNVPNGTPVIDFDHQMNGAQYMWEDGKVTATVDPQR